MASSDQSTTARRPPGTGLRRDLPLERDASARFLPWLIALMVYLAALALTAAMIVSDATAEWNRGISGRLTVQIPPPAEGQAPTMAPLVEGAVTVLRATPGIAEVEVMSETEVNALLRPWLGEAGSLGDLPVPALVKVRLSPGAELDLDSLGARLRAEAPGAVVDDHRSWLSALIDFSRTIQVIAALVVLLVGLAAVAAVVFVTRTGLSIHMRVIEMLHLVGARDGYIARQFQGHALRLGLLGGVAGVALAGATVLAASLVLENPTAAFQAPAGDTRPVPGVPLGPWQLSAVGAIPLITALVATVTARVTVMRTLRRMH